MKFKIFTILIILTIWLLACNTITKTKYQYYSACYIFDDNFYRKFMMDFHPDNYFYLRNLGSPMTGTFVGKWEMLSSHELLIRIDDIRDTLAREQYHPHYFTQDGKIRVNHDRHFPKINNDTVFFSDNYETVRWRVLEFFFARSVNRDVIDLIAF